MENPRKRPRLQEKDLQSQSQTQSQTQPQSQLDADQKAWEETKNEIQRILKDVCKQKVFIYPKFSLLTFQLQTHSPATISRLFSDIRQPQ